MGLKPREESSLMGPLEDDKWDQTYDDKSFASHYPEDEARIREEERRAGVADPKNLDIRHDYPAVKYSGRDKGTEVVGSSET